MERMDRGARLGGNCERCRSAGCAVNATGMKRAEIPGRQDVFLQSHLPGVASHMSLRMTYGLREEKTSLMRNLRKRQFKQRTGMWSFFLQVPTPFNVPGPVFSRLSPGKVSLCPGPPCPCWAGSAVLMTTCLWGPGCLHPSPSFPAYVF